MATSPSSASAAAKVDPAVWRAVVSSSVEIPPVGSHVYYFPEGHLEHSGSPPSSLRNYSFALSRPFIPCRLLSARFLADPPADQLSVQMLLQPLDPRSSSSAAAATAGVPDDDVVSFAKALTPSDAGGGGGFSIPKFCAEMIFPPLEQPSGQRPPNQGLTVRDARGRPWEFRHIYRGTPRRHLLSTGWSRFVKAKQLVAGDVVVFVGRRSTGEVFAGVRKARRFTGGRDGELRAGAREAVRRAAAGMGFEVVYYPELGFPDFVVRAEKVMEGLRAGWAPGMRLRMAADSDDLARATWIQGTVVAATSSSGNWLGSTWRMLHVVWDVPESLSSRVCPWQVELISSTGLHIFPPLPKRLKLRHDSSYIPLLGGTQGARRDHVRRIGKTSCDLRVNEHQGLGPPPVSTVLKLGRSCQSVLPPVVRMCGGDLQAGCSSAFRLFGKVIETRAGFGGCSGSNCIVSCTCGSD
ncbi:auxin response factor [Striga asiatica]|uniref:Auxin response factor n=1 Tax=Striga asiatica TaxID=4170 RepID=A0A5A7Q5M0_STRAF|nr:auxin response factor [Striga asiatica]